MMSTLGPLPVRVATESPQMMQMNMDMSCTWYELKGQTQVLGVQTFMILYSKPLKASTETKTKTATKTATHTVRRKTVQWILVLSTTKTATQKARRKTVQWILVLSMMKTATKTPVMKTVRRKTVNNMKSLVAVVAVVAVIEAVAKVMVVKELALVEVHILTVLFCIIR
jgi:hypothetical protein